ncbi:MAG: hypothetical protein QM831_26780 [Kofleriaceae bacterium]
MRVALVIMLASLTASADPRVSDVASARLNAIGTKLTFRDVPPQAFPGCTLLTKSDRKAVEIDTHAFIDSQHPDERQSDEAMQPELAWVFSTGCREPDGTVYVSASQDRVAKTSKTPFSSALRRNYLLAIDAKHQARVIEESQGTSSDGWIGGAERGGFDVVAQLDIDGDGKRDFIYAKIEHPGSTTHVRWHVTAQLGTGAKIPFVTVENLDTMFVGGRLVFGAWDGYTDSAAACVTKDLRLERCAAAQRMTKWQAYNSAVSHLALAGSRDDADRDYTGAQLAVVGIHDKALVESLPETTPAQRVGREVKAFLAAKNLDNAWNQLFVVAHPDATAYMDQIARQLGDTRCTITPLTDKRSEQLRAFARTRAKTKNINVLVAPECGTYAWVEYTREKDELIYDDLVSIAGPEPELLHQFTYQAEWAFMPLEDTFHYTGSFFLHGTTVVGLILRHDNLYVVSGNKIVASSHGYTSMYPYDSRWTEQSFDFIHEEGNGYLHATPTGLERLDPEPLRDHDTRQAAIDLLLATDDSVGATNTAPYIAALKLLGADAKLVAECEAL